MEGSYEYSKLKSHIPEHKRQDRTGTDRNNKPLPYTMTQNSQTVQQP